MRTRRLLVVAAPAASILALAAPALGDSAGRGAGGVPGAPASLGATHSHTFAGWEINTSEIQAGFTISATVVLPKLKCGAEPHAIHPGVGGYYGSTLNPNHFSDAGMFVGCNEGKIFYFPAFTLNGNARNFRNLKLHAGDTVVLEASVQASGTTLSLVDKTTKGVNKTLTGKGHSSTIGPWAADSAWINFSEGGLEPVPNFGKLTFSHARLDGQPFGGAAGLVQYDRYRHSTLQISTSPFKSDQETFTTVYHHA